MSTSFKRIVPLLNRIVVKKLQAPTKTASGIIMNKSDQNSYGVVLECGPGSFDSHGKVIPLVLKVGDQVMLPEYGGQKVKLAEQELYIYRESDIVAKME